MLVSFSGSPLTTDVMDGHFVPNITMGAPILTCVKKNVPDIFMDCHMMVSDPAHWVEDVAKAGGKLYTFHYEAASESPWISGAMTSP